MAERLEINRRRFLQLGALTVLSFLTQGGKPETERPGEIIQMTPEKNLVEAPVLSLYTERDAIFLNSNGKPINPWTGRKEEIVVGCVLQVFAIGQRLGEDFYKITRYTDDQQLWVSTDDLWGQGEIEGDVVDDCFWKNHEQVEEAFGL